MLKEENLLTIKEAAAYLKYHPEYLRQLARQGDVKAMKVRGGRWRFRKEDLDAILVRVYPEEVDEK